MTRRDHEEIRNIVISRLQIRNTVSDHFTPAGVAVMEKTDNEYWGGWEGIGSLRKRLVGMSTVQLLWKNNLAAPQSGGNRESLSMTK